MPPTDAQLVERALDGSQDAYRELVERYQKPVFSLVVRMVRDRGVAEELAQDAFVKAFSHLSTFDPRHKLSSWLFKIAHNTTIDHLRRKRVDTVPLETPEPEEGELLAVLEDPSARSPEALAGRIDVARGLEEAVAELRPEYREVVLLRFQQGLAYDEIAEVMEMPLGTVKTHIHRARKELVASLTRMGVEP